MAHTKESIIRLLETRDDAVARAVHALYKLQTEQERRVEETLHHNGVGFSATHGHIGTSMGKDFAERGFLTPRQIRWWRVRTATGRQRIDIYAAQLAKIANKEIVA